ncbi:hypothetical protein Q1695_015603 [Nippostrongylus brasiliensis]|nr:hypothetical protein Q1695_015603 [Nippostrongylus brasiliensis]
MRYTILLLAIIFCAQACSSNGNAPAQASTGTNPAGGISNGKGPVKASIHTILTKEEAADGTYVGEVTAALDPCIADGRFGSVRVDVMQEQTEVTITIQFSNADCSEVKDYFKQSAVLKDAFVKC